MSLKSFLIHHAADLHAVAHVLGTVVGASGIGGEDKERAAEAIGSLVKSAENIVASIGDVKDVAGHVDLKAVKSAAIDAATGALPGLVAALVAKEVAKLSKPKAPKATATPTT